MIGGGTKYESKHTSVSKETNHPRPRSRRKGYLISSHGDTDDLWSTLFDKFHRHYKS